MTGFFRMRDQVLAFYHTRGQVAWHPRYVLLTKKTCSVLESTLTQMWNSKLPVSSKAYPLGIAEWYKVHHNGGVGFVGN